jgi:hypothetical protein
MPLTEGTIKDARKATTESLVRPIQAPPSPNPRRLTKAPEEYFLDHINTLIKNLFIENINFKNRYYEKTFGYSFEAINAIKDSVKNSAEYILGEIERTKHLIKDDADET